MPIKLSLSVEEIYNHTFKLGKGYNSYEVDLFLDKIICDYLSIENNCLIEKKEMEKLNEKIKILEDENRRLEIANTKLQSRFDDIKDSDNVTSDNMDLIKKVNRYEKFLFRHGFNPNFLDDDQ